MSFNFSEPSLLLTDNVVLFVIRNAYGQTEQLIYETVTIKKGSQADILRIEIVYKEGGIYFGKKFYF
jgi:hypothetical protein